MPTPRPTTTRPHTTRPRVSFPSNKHSKSPPPKKTRRRPPARPPAHAHASPSQPPPQESPNRPPPKTQKQTDLDALFAKCDPDKENLCLYGERDGSWSVDLPAEEVPPELPEPCLGVNFARDGMERRDWAALVAVHSDAWLAAVAAFYAVKLDAAGRARLHRQTDALPTLFEVVTGRAGAAGAAAAAAAAAAGGGVGASPGGGASAGGGGRSKGGGGGGGGGRGQGGGGQRGGGAAAAADNGDGDDGDGDGAGAPLPSFPQGTTAGGHASHEPNPAGRMLRQSDVGPALAGRFAELLWPDDTLWYVVQIVSVDARARTAQIVYSTAEQEELDLDEILRDSHMSLLPA